MRCFTRTTTSASTNAYALQDQHKIELEFKLHTNKITQLSTYHHLGIRLLRTAQVEGHENSLVMPVHHSGFDSKYQYEAEGWRE